MKEILNLMGKDIGVVFSDSTHTLTLGDFINLLSDRNPLLSPPECRIVFNYISTKYEFPGKKIEAYRLLNELSTVEKTGLKREITDALRRAEENSGLSLTDVIDDLEITTEEGPSVADLRSHIAKGFRGHLSRPTVDNFVRMVDDNCNQVASVLEIQKVLQVNSRERKISIELQLRHFANLSDFTEQTI